MSLAPHIKSLTDDLLSMAKGITIKRQDLADKYDSLSTIHADDYYMLVIKGQDNFMSYIKYPESVLQAAGLSEDEIVMGLKSKANIPVSKQNAVLTNMRQYILNTYVEHNNYYRCLNGLPDIEDSSFIYIKDTISGVDISKPIHLMNDDEIFILRNLGIINTLILKYPDKKYLKYLGNYKINLITARLADRFEILQLGPCSSSVHESMFRANYELARRYIVRTHYLSNSFGDQTQYDAYIGLRILTNAIIYTISQNVDILNNQTYNDLQTCKYILQSYGLDIFDDIPFKYRKKISDNIELLIKYKGTNNVFNIIYRIFGFTKTDIYKYLLIKQNKKDTDGNFIMSDDNAQKYDLNMVQVPIDSKNIALDMENNNNYINYDSVTNNDPFWGVYETNDSIKTKLLNHEFNYIETKYISINTAYDITKMNFEINYLMNTLLAFKNNENSINIILSESSKPIPLFDVIVYLFALLSKLYNFEGNIPSSMSGVASAYRFNFEANITDLLNIYNQYDIDVQNYIPINSIQISKPSHSIVNGNELLTYYFNNENIYNTLVNAMNNATSEVQYSLAKQLFQYYTISKQTTSIYTKSDGNIAITYLDYLISENPILAYSVQNIAQENISDKITDVLIAIESVINSDKLNYMFSKIPIGGDTVIKKYISEVINVFKSYTVDIQALNMVYNIDDKTNNRFKLMDFIIINPTYYHDDGPHLITSMLTIDNYSESTSISLRDEVDISIIRGGIEYETE